MPELPEVQTVVDDLNAAGIPGLTVTGARVFWPRTIATSTPETFRRRVMGFTVGAVHRRAKYIVIDLLRCGDGRATTGTAALLVHLRMSGRLHWVPFGTPRLDHEHAILAFDNGMELRLHDTRKFGRISLVGDPAEVLGGLGPEPLDATFTTATLAEILNGRRRLLKPLLLDQTVIAGLGNIYADEALWEARLHPLRSSATLSRDETAALHRAIRTVLRRGLKNLGTTLGTGETNFYSVARRRGRNSDRLKVFRRTGEPCPRCGSEIERIIVGQRSTHVCPACQKPAWACPKPTRACPKPTRKKKEVHTRGRKRRALR